MRSKVKILMPKTLTFLLMLLLFASNVYARQEETYDSRLKQAAKLFKQRKYVDALAILEKLASENPGDDQSVFGYGVALVMSTRSASSEEDRARLAETAYVTLEAAKKLGVEDFMLNQRLNRLISDSKYDRKAELQSLATLWTLHPPMIFDSQPPAGIVLPEGYRHKDSMDFEGMVGGLIWKPNVLRIKYEFCNIYQEDVVGKSDKNSYTWYEERQFGDHKFKCALTKKNQLIVSVLLSAKRDSPVATFFCDVKDQGDVEKVLAIVTGLKERSSFKGIR